MTTLAEIKARWPRPVGLDNTTGWANSDIEWLIGQLEEAMAQATALHRALLDVEVLAHDAERDAYAAAELARMARTNDPVPASPLGGEGR